MAAEDGENPPSATIYIRNLNERVKVPALVEEVRELFEDFGTIVEIIAKKNIKAKGQMFIVFESAEEAQEAIDTMNEFELHGKPMKIAFAKTRSDATVKREDGDEELETHKRHRLAEKERKQALEAANQKTATAKRAAPEPIPERPAKTSKTGVTPGGVVPDEYLPPNKILFLRELPDDYGKEGLTAIFTRFPGFKEVRMVPGRKGIGFVEYENEDGAITAKEATAGMTLGEKAIRVTFQRQ